MAGFSKPSFLFLSKNWHIYFIPSQIVAFGFLLSDPWLLKGQLLLYLGMRKQEGIFTLILCASFTF